MKTTKRVCVLSAAMCSARAHLLYGASFECCDQNELTVFRRGCLRELICDFGSIFDRIISLDDLYWYELHNQRAFKIKTSERKISL